MLNLICAMGRLTKDPGIRMVNEKKFANFTIASTRDKHNDTDYMDCSICGKLAEVVELYVHKGMLVTVTGRLQSRKWEKDGVKRTSWEIRCDNIYFSDNKPKADVSTTSYKELMEPEAGELPF